jgi:Ion channel.
MNAVDKPPLAGLRRFSMAQLLIALALLLFSLPFVDDLESGELIVSVLFSLVLLAAVLAVANRRSTLLIALILAIPAVVGRWINLIHPNVLSAMIFLVAGIALVIFVIMNLLRFVLGAPSVDEEVLCASISAYLMLGLTWTMAYWLVDQVDPTAFNISSPTGSKQTMGGFNAFYFSFITLSTVGYGDITPVAKVARMLAAVEATTGLLYVAVLIGRLVGLYSNGKSE